MYKSKLQELCDQKKWSLPNYTSIKDGPDHNPSFKASVLINATSFETTDSCRSSKEAQNEAARLALIHFSSFDHRLKMMMDIQIPAKNNSSGSLSDSSTDEKLGRERQRKGKPSSSTKQGTWAKENHKIMDPTAREIERLEGLLDDYKTEHLKWKAKYNEAKKLQNGQTYNNLVRHLENLNDSLRKNNLPPSEKDCLKRQIKIVELDKNRAERKCKGKVVEVTCDEPTVQECASKLNDYNQKMLDLTTQVSNLQAKKKEEIKKKVVLVHTPWKDALMKGL